eukprot:Rmarinus@m.23812
MVHFALRQSLRYCQLCGTWSQVSPNVVRPVLSSYISGGVSLRALSRKPLSFDDDADEQDHDLSDYRKDVEVEQDYYTFLQRRPVWKKPVRSEREKTIMDIRAKVFGKIPYDEGPRNPYDFLSRPMQTDKKAQWFMTPLMPRLKWIKPVRQQILQELSHEEQLSFRPFIYGTHFDRHWSWRVKQLSRRKALGKTITQKGEGKRAQKLAVAKKKK